MILVFLFVGAIIFAVSNVFFKNKTVKITWSIIGLILTIGSIVLIILNSNQHFGMKTVHFTKTYSLVTSVPRKKVLLYKQIGTKDERIYFYKTNPMNKKLQNTEGKLNNVGLKEDTKKTQLKVTKKYWVYKNEEFRLLFSSGIPNHQFINRHYSFSLKSGWSTIELPTNKNNNANIN